MTLPDGSTNFSAYDPPEASKLLSWLGGARLPPPEPYTVNYQTGEEDTKKVRVRSLVKEEFSDLSESLSAGEGGDGDLE